MAWWTISLDDSEGTNAAGRPFGWTLPSKKLKPTCAGGVTTPSTAHPMPSWQRFCVVSLMASNIVATFTHFGRKPGAVTSTLPEPVSKVPACALRSPLSSKKSTAVISQPEAKASPQLMRTPSVMNESKAASPSTVPAVSSSATHSSVMPRRRVFVLSCALCDTPATAH